MALHIIINTGYSLFVASFYCYLGTFILNSEQSAFRIFSLGNMANTVGLMLGWGLGLLVNQAVDSGAPIILVVVFMYVLLFVSIFAFPVFQKNIFDAKLEETLEQDSHQGENLSSVFPEDTLSTCCTIIAKEFGLSSREKDVMAYLIRGRSLKFIASDLSLSLNTVKTHTAHLYEKLAVHTRDEVIQLFEKTNAESRQRQDSSQI
jgi:DNA-binding CsgD family transcriptional regulator